MRVCRPRGHDGRQRDHLGRDHAPPTDASDEPPLFAHIRANEIGAGLLPIHTPFGARATVYADYTWRPAAVIHRGVRWRRFCWPTYGNTHTTTSKTGRQSSDFVAEARTMVRNYLRCGKHDNILFLGSGATAGANRLVAMLGPAAPPAARAAARARPEAERPIVFVGPYEHHSNLLPWRDSIADVVQIGEAAHGGPDLAQLQAALEAAAARPLRVGAFSAASNVSGALTDVDAVTALLHSHNALAIWDYASAAPHAPVCMNPPAAAAAHASLLAKDAVFFSPHKFPGGPQAAGVLVLKSHLAELYCKGTADGRRASVAPGGGSVFFVSRDAHVYARAEEAREEAGTPPIIGAVRVAPSACSCNRLSGGGRSRRRTSVYCTEWRRRGDPTQTSRCSATARAPARRRAPSRRGGCRSSRSPCAAVI